MHIQIVNFRLVGMTELEYAEACVQQFAPAFRDLPGLISKIWLINPETNTYGGVYTWRDKASMETYKNSELFNAIVTNPRFTGLTSSDFAVMEAPTRVTNESPAASA